MGRTPCCDKKGLKKGPWTAEEDEILVDYINKNGGHGSWRSLPKLAGLLRCGKSCRLRWTNYLRPDIKRGPFTPEEEKLVIQLHAILGNRWAAIASQLAGRTDNEIKNLWNTHLKKRLLCMGLDPQTHKPLTTSFSSPSNSSSSSNADVAAAASSSLSTRHMAQWESARLEAEARLSKDSSLFFHSSLPPPHHATCPFKRRRDDDNNNNDRDFFLRLWNSDVGDAFRNTIIRKLDDDDNDDDGGDAATCHNLVVSSPSPSISAVKTEVVDAVPIISSNEGDDNSTSISNVDDLEDSSDTALQLLLDFPICNNDMSFLEGTSFVYKTMLY